MVTYKLIVFTQHDIIFSITNGGQMVHSSLEHFFILPTTFSDGYMPQASPIVSNCARG